MPFVEAVTIEIGAAIAKSIFKFWVKDSTLGADISSSLIDLFKTRTSDVLAQRRGQRLFEAIGEKVGESLLPLFESEGSRLGESDRNAVALAVAEAFNKSKLSSKLLADRNLEPTMLEKHILDSHSAQTRDFSEAETALYQRIIKESCTYIVDIASQLPSFTEHTFAEILKREDKIIDKTNEILEELQRMRKQLDPMIEAEHFEILYRQAVARNLDILQLVGTDVSLANRRHRLSVAYITLSVAQKGHSLLTTGKSSRRLQNEAEWAIVSVNTALAGSHSLLILGEPGSGKTTLLQWIAVKAATKSFEEDLSSWNGNLPFYIRLRHHVQSDLPRPEAFPSLVAPLIADTMPKGWVHAVLDSGRAIVLVDGIDEIPASRREDIHTWLNDLLETYKKARFIITSRPYAIDKGWMNNKGLTDAELQPMELIDIYSFIDHWHIAVREELHTDEEKKELGPLAEHLKENVRYTRAMRNLATNPLLCAMLCALNRDRRRQLPDNRIELYQACCSMLLERRDKESRVDLTDYPALNYGQKQRLLEDLAYYMLTENLSEAAITTVDERFTRKLADMPGISQEASSVQVRKLLVERSGIIREPVVNQIDFSHRTFQEFFAAQAALNAMNIKVLITNAHNDQWREVVILAAGLASKGNCEKLIEGLIARGDKDKEHRYQLHLTAVSCLETAIELGPGVRAEVERRLSQLVPPKDMIDAKALAAAGELAVKHLGKKGDPTGTTSAACVYALAIIGGDAALDMLEEEYANDSREPVINELVRAWDSFDRKVYARRVLSHTFRNKSNLHMERPSSLDGLQYLSRLTVLHLNNCAHLSDLTPLASLPRLTVLYLSDCTQFMGVTPLGSLTTLARLSLPNCDRLSDVTALASLTRLTELNLSGCTQLSDVTPLAALTNLTELNLSGCIRLSKVMPLVSLTRLTKLNLSGCTLLSNISLTGLTNLIELNLSGCTRLSNVMPLVGLKSLIVLNLGGCIQLSNLSLTGLMSLTKLDLSNYTELKNLSLASLTHLAELNLRGCIQLKDLGLTNLIRLTKLDLSGCTQLSDVTPLADLIHLTELNLSGCTQLSDISALANLNNLRKLILSKDADKLTIPSNIKEKARIWYI